MKKSAVSLACLLLSGCFKIGPANLEYDNMSYNSAVHNSVDSQLLLNIARLRYRDNPTFLQVGVISSAYEFRRSLAADFNFEINGTDVVKVTPKSSMDYNEKPTVTYQPLRGEGFVKEMLAPVPLQSITLLHASGWKIDRIFRCCVQRMNDLRNAPTASGPTPREAPEYQDFIETAKLLRALEMADSLRLVPEKNGKTGNIEYFLILDTENGNREILSQVWRSLDLEPGTSKIKLVQYHGREHGKDEIFIDTRSPLSVLYFLSQGVDVPPIHEAVGKVTVTTDEKGEYFDWGHVLGGIIEVHSSCKPPVCSSVWVKYRGLYYWINDNDLDSKSTFSLLTQLMALQTGCPSLPVITTIPLNN